MDAEKRIHEEWLDAALRARADCEPRAGLEDRLLARLASEPPRKALAWWPTVAASVAIVVIAIALMTMRQGQPNQSLPINAASPRIGSASDGGAARNPAVTAVNKAATKLPSRSTHRTETREPINRKAERLPMLATFPAPRPETQQERMLARLSAKGVSFAGIDDPVDLAELRDLPVPEFKIRPMEEAPSDDTPQE
jgi:hypothetical protein